MVWSWSEMPDWVYALTTAGMMLLWIMVIFGAILVVHFLGRENRSTAEQASSSRPADGSLVAESPSESNVLALRDKRTDADRPHGPDVRDRRPDAPADRRGRTRRRRRSDAPACPVALG